MKWVKRKPHSQCSQEVWAALYILARSLVYKCQQERKKIFSLPSNKPMRNCCNSANEKLPQPQTLCSPQWAVSFKAAPPNFLISSIKECPLSLGLQGFHISIVSLSLIAILLLLPETNLLIFWLSYLYLFVLKVNRRNLKNIPKRL